MHDGFIKLLFLISFGTFPVHGSQGSYREQREVFFAWYFVQLYSPSKTFS